MPCCTRSDRLAPHHSPAPVQAQAAATDTTRARMALQIASHAHDATALHSRRTRWWQRRWCPPSALLRLLWLVVLLLGGDHRVLPPAHAQATLFTPQDVPGPPERVYVSALDDSAMRVQFLPPARTMAEGSHGAPVLGYKVEVARRVHDVQRFTVSANGPITDGSYTLTFANARGTGTTRCLPWNASEIAFEMALEELLHVDSVSVSRSGYNAMSYGYEYTVVFDGRYLVVGAQPNVLVGSQAGCRPTRPLNRVLTLLGSHVTVGVPGYEPEVWELSTTSSSANHGDVIGGAFDLSIGFQGEWVDTGVTASIQAGGRVAITSAAMLGRVNRGDTVRIGAATSFTVHATARFTDTELPLDAYHIRGVTNAAIYLRDTSLGDVAVLSGSNTVSTVNDLRALVAVNEHIQLGSYEFKVTALTATSLTVDKIAIDGPSAWPDASQAHLTAYRRRKVRVTAHADAQELKRALDLLPGVGVVAVSRVGPTRSQGFRWQITFLSLGGHMKCPTSPCLHADTVTGTQTPFTDAYGLPCASCHLDVALLTDDSNNLLPGVAGEYDETAIVATREVGGVVDEEQTITVTSTVNDLYGTFAVNFQHTFAETSGAIINCDDTAMDMQTKLQALPTVGRVLVTRVTHNGSLASPSLSPSSSPTYGYTWTVTFVTNMGDQPMFLLDAQELVSTGTIHAVAMEAVKGVDSAFEAIVDGLEPHADYYVRAFAKNINGYGLGTDLIQQYGGGVLPLSTAIASAPGVVGIIGTWPISGTQLGIRFAPPDAHGAEITKYVFEYAMGGVDSFGDPAIKKIRITSELANDVAGTFRLQYGDALTPLLVLHTTALDLMAALRQLPSLRPVVVSRATYVLVGSPTHCVTSLLANKNTLTTTFLSTAQRQLLVGGARIAVGSDTFTVLRVLSSALSETTATIEVHPDHGVADFTATRSLVVLDATGSVMGPHGYEWTLTFRNEADQISHAGYPGLQFVPALTSIEHFGASLDAANYGITDVQVASPVVHRGSFEVSTDDATCDTYLIGAPSSDQVLQLMASTTITDGAFQLQLGEEVTACIATGTLHAATFKSNVQASLLALPSIHQARVSEERAFRLLLISGSSTSRVTAYAATPKKLTVTALTSAQADALRRHAVIQVSRNPNDATRHACEFTLSASTAAGDTEIFVTDTALPPCGEFSGESRAIRMLDAPALKIRLSGRYPTGFWPTLKVVPAAFGDGATCTAWEPAGVVRVYSEIHTVKYEGTCVSGHRGTQTILADAQSAIGGFFTLSYLGRETPSLAFQTTTAEHVRDALMHLLDDGDGRSEAPVAVTETKYGSHGKAWRITFLSMDASEDTLFIKHSYLTGQDVSISVYPTVEIQSHALRDDITGTFRISFAGVSTERIAHTATHAKVAQELQKLTAVASIVALGETGDVGVSPLTLLAAATSNSAMLTNLQLPNGDVIDATLFLAVREMVIIDDKTYWIQSLSADELVLTASFTGTTGTVTLLAGSFTRSIAALPGHVSIPRLMRVITATPGSKVFELPLGHGYTSNDVFFVGGTRFSVDTVADGSVVSIVTAYETYAGDTIVASVPEVYVFDNKLRTTSDLSTHLSVGDELWLPVISSSSSSVSTARSDDATLRNAVQNPMIKYTVSAAPTSQYVPVSGLFSDSIIAATAFHVGYGRTWTLVFRSYLDSLETIDAIPDMDWRGTAARLGAYPPQALASHTFTVGNPRVCQTVLLEAVSASDVGAAATYTLAFGDDVTNPMPWTATSDEIKTKLELLDSVDGVSVVSVAHDHGFLHTIDFWGMYTVKTLPTLVGTVTAATDVSKCSVLVRRTSSSDVDASDVATTKRDHLILKNSDTLAFRLFAVNEKGISDAPTLFHAETSTKSVIPTPPTSVSLGEYHGATWLSVHYLAPVYSGGAEITMYRLEWDSSPTFDSTSSDYGVATIQKKMEVQQVVTQYRSDSTRGGFFTLSWGGRTTALLPYDCSAAAMSDALAILTDTANIAVDPVKVLRTQAGWGYSWKITFLHTPGDLALLVADGSQISGDFPQIIVKEVVKGVSDLAIGDFTYEVQDVYTDAASVVGGTFMLSFEGNPTPLISVDASALEMQDALQSTTSLYSIKVSRTWRNQVLNLAVWSVTFAYLRGDEMVGAGNIFTIQVKSTASLTGAAARVKVANKIIGSDPFQYTLTGLRRGVTYYMHVMAYNAEGFGSSTSPLSRATTCAQPEPSASVMASVVDGTTLAVEWSAPEHAEGSSSVCAIDRYKVEWYRTEGIREMQTITTSASQGVPEVQRLVSRANSQSLSGFFKLSFRGETTENLAWNAPASGTHSIKERLERLAAVGTIDVTRQESVRVVDGLMVTTAGDTVTVDSVLSSVSLPSTGLAIGDMVQILDVAYTIATMPAGDTTFTVAEVGTLPTTAISVPIFWSSYGYDWRITFQGGHVGPQEQIKVIPSDSWAGDNPGIFVETFQRGLQPISGAFRVSFANDGVAQTTQPLPFDISASALRDALENLVTMGAVEVTRSVNGYGFNWQVTFLTDVKNDISLLSVDGTELHGPNVGISSAIIRIGSQPTYYGEHVHGATGPAAIVTMPGSLRYVLSGLTTGRGYAIRVRAHNQEGYGAAGYISPAFQTPRTIPSTPTQVDLLVLSSRLLKLRWMPPTSDGGSQITAYRVQWDKSDVFANVDSPNYDGNVVMNVVASATAPLYFNLPILEAAGAVTPPYYARVMAINDQGQGIAATSTPIMAQPMDRTPGQPEQATATVLSNYAILVEWAPSSIQKPYYGGDGGLPITQYMVEWDPSVDFDSPASFALVAGATTSYLIGGDDPITGVRSDVLIAGTMYSIRVTAFNAQGAGTPRATSPAQILAANQLPSVPRHLALTVIPATSIHAQWDNPLYDGGESMKSYEIEWDEENDFTSGQSARISIPIVREMQAVTVSTNVVNEEQLIDATVEVVNEVQVVRSSFTGVDEVQTITTTNQAVEDEVQSVTTTATDRNEVQVLYLTADDINEVQAIRSTIATEVLEVQTIQVGVSRQSEVQTLTLTITGAGGADANRANIGGTLFLSFDNTACTFCTQTKGYATTGNLIASLTTVDDTNAALTVKNALDALSNIDSVTVSRTTPDSAVDVQYVYSITFAGLGVAGDVPTLGVTSTITYNGAAVGGIPTVATQTVQGGEVTFHTDSVFTVTHTCEAYSDPAAITTFSSACTPATTICAACVSSFDSSALTLTITGVNLVGTVLVGDRLVVGPCVVEAATVTATSITIVNDIGVGTRCSPLSGGTWALYRAVQQSTAIALKTGATILSSASVVNNALNSLVTSVSVVQEISVTNAFVGVLYHVTFLDRSGTLPLLECDATNMGVSTGATKVCAVTRPTIGSMIYGTFTVSLARESDGTVVTTPSIAWDASAATMKATMEAMVSGDTGEQVFGTVAVTRAVFAPTAHKWSGGFTWVIEFTSRGWDIPKMSVTTTNLRNVDGTATAPSVAVEDASSAPLSPYAGSVNGNQIDGQITFTFNGGTTEPCLLGTHTDDTTAIHAEVEDSLLQAFLVAQLPDKIPSIHVMRSAVNQARGFTWTFTFSDKANGGDVPMLSVTSVLSGVRAATKVDELVKGNQLSGTFQLSCHGETTGPILFSADASVVQAQLNSLASIKPSSVAVTRVGPSITEASQVLSYTWLITFRSSTWADPTSDHSSGITGNWFGARAKWEDVWETGYSKAWGRHVGPMATNGFAISCLDDGLSTTAFDDSQDCVTNVEHVGKGPIKGSFAITLDSSTSPFMSVQQVVTSGAIAHNAWATKEQSGAMGTSVEEILEAMANVGDVQVSRSAVDPTNGGYTWTVTFLRDANGPCDQEEDITPTTDGDVVVASGTSGSRCNSPGDVPAMVPVTAGLSGSSPSATVAPIHDGRILRGDFTLFQVTDDPGFGARYFVTIICTNGGAPPCNPIESFAIAPGSDGLANHLVAGDRFTVGAHSTCIYTALAVTSTTIQVKDDVVTCASMVAGMTNTAISVYPRMPWNADASLVKRVLEASSDQADEHGVWANGRKVLVTRTIHGKYGEVSWRVQFISNPGFTPPGAGNIATITTLFAPEPPSLTGVEVGVTQVTPGSIGLSDSFLVDFHSTVGPRAIRFDESAERLQRKLNEMNTIGSVTVKKFQYPSTDTGCMDTSCSGGWDDQAVAFPGTRGGYRWRVRFMEVTGEYGGLTFPSGSGNVGPLAVTTGTLQGNQRAIDVTTSRTGSAPLLGEFVLSTSKTSTPELSYAATADSIKQSIEAMHMFGDVDVTRDLLLMQQIPDAVATVFHDGITATISGIDDIRQYLAPGDMVRFGPVSANNLVGTNGDAPITGVLASSIVTLHALSPIVAASPVVTKLLFPDMQLRLDGRVYNVHRSGREVQTLTVSRLTTGWVENEVQGFFKLTMRRGGVSVTTATCLAFNADAVAVETALQTLLQTLATTLNDGSLAVAGDIKVTRAANAELTTADGSRKGYVHSIYFLGDIVSGDVATLMADTSTCTAIASATAEISVRRHGGQIAHQRLSLATDSGVVVDPTGYFKLALNGRTTQCLGWGISANALETELKNTLLTGNVLVARRGSGQSVTELQRLRMTANAAVTTSGTGLFRLALTVDGETAWTSCLAYGVTAETMAAAINGMSHITSSVAQVSVTRDGDGSTSWGYGYEYRIAFDGPISGGYSKVMGNIHPLEVVNIGQSPCAPVVGGEPALILETVRQGHAGYMYDVFFLDYLSAAPPNTAYTATLSIQHEGNGGVCTSGWSHTGGSVRKAWVDMLALGGSAEVQSLTIKDEQAVIDPATSYKLSFGGTTTASCLAYNADASALESALNLLAAIGSGGVLVSRDQHPVRSPNGFIYLITFVGELTTGNVPRLGLVLNDASCHAFASTSSVTVMEVLPGGRDAGEFVTTELYAGESPGPHPAYSVAQVFTVMPEQITVQQLIVSNAANDIASNAVYTLTVLGVTTSSIAWDASEDDLEAALTVVGVTEGDIVATRRLDAALAPHGFVYTIYFRGDTVSGLIATLAVASKTGFNSGDVVPSRLTAGVDGVVPFRSTAIPLAKPLDATTPSKFLASDASLSVFKVNGFLWTIKFKSMIGNLAALTTQTNALTGGDVTVVDDFVAGSASNSVVLTSLLPGIKYFVRVAASSDMGVGQFTAPVSATPSGHASAVQAISAGAALFVREVQEVRVAATHVTEVQTITTSAAPIAEVQILRTTAAAELCFDGHCVLGGLALRVPTIQTITVSALSPITAGTFAIRFVRYQGDGAGGFTAVGTQFVTDPMAWDASPDVVQDKLSALSALTANDLVVTRDGDGSSAFAYGYTFSITFVGNDVAGETEPMEVLDSTTGCAACTAFATTGNVAHTLTVHMNTQTAMGTDTMIQQVIIRASKPLYAGSYQLSLTHLGATVTSSTCVQFDALARSEDGEDIRTMEAILLSMSNIDHVYVTRTMDDTLAPNGFIYHVFFYGNGVRDIAQAMTWTPCVAFQTQENNALTASGVNGDVAISILDPGQFNTLDTFVDAAEATASQLETDLGRLPLWGPVIVTRSLVDRQGGFVWTIAFEDAQGDLPQFICGVDTAFQTSMATYGARCETSTLTHGNALSGSFVVDSSPAIAFDASATAMKQALEAMVWVGTVQVERSVATPQMGFTWTITFLDYVGDVPTLLATSSLVGTGSEIVVTEVRKGNQLEGGFTLAYRGEMTERIATNAPATSVESMADGSSMQEKLEALALVGAVRVTRSTMDREGGYAWQITFLDDRLNVGDLPLLQASTQLDGLTILTGVGAVVATREVVKGANAVGHQLWLSFTPPETDNGSPIHSYRVRWDTSAQFTANPGDATLADPATLFQVQHVTTGAPSIAWSSLRGSDPVQEIQAITFGTDTTAFELSFREVLSATLTVGVSTAADLLAALNGISSAGTVTVTPTMGTLSTGAVFYATFTSKPGDLPLLIPTDPMGATVAEHVPGVTRYRKAVEVFTCLATGAGILTLQFGALSTTVAQDAALELLSTQLHVLFNLEEGGLRVMSSTPTTQTAVCATTAPAARISIVFDHRRGDVEDLVITSSSGLVTVARVTAACIDGVYDDVEATMSGTFQVGYKNAFTRSLNAESSAEDVRYALEDLASIHTVAVNRDQSAQVIPTAGTVDVVQGQVYVTCSMHQVCDFRGAAYGLPGHPIRLADTWYTVRSSSSSMDDLDATRLYLGDLNNREVGYKGATASGVAVHEWTKGYTWQVYLMAVEAPLTYLHAKIPRLHPMDASVRITGSSCVKCYYLPTGTTRTLTMGQSYFIDVTALNENGAGALPMNGPIQATPRQVPDAPSNVDLVVVSGQQIEVFFAPPMLTTSSSSRSVSPDLNNDITAYLVQWDVTNDFKHGLMLCPSCVVSFQVNTLLVTQSLLTKLVIGTRLTIGDDTCVVTVSDPVSVTRVDVNPGHGCNTFTGKAYALHYFTYAPMVLSGQQITGSPPFRFLIPNLVVNTRYYVRVAAVNSVPVQSIALSGVPPDNRQWSYPLSATTKHMVPDPPVHVALAVFAGTTLEVQIQPPTRDGQGLNGAAITSYWIDFDTVSTFDSVTKAAPVTVTLASGDLPVLYSGGPHIYYLSGLTTGVRYFVQVKAVNSVGLSRATLAPQPLAPSRAPDGAVNVKVSTLRSSAMPIDSATVTWQRPLSDGGLPITSYVIEYWRASGVGTASATGVIGASRPEVQVIELQWATAPTSALFSLGFGGSVTGSMPMDVTPENLRSALMNLVPIGGPALVGHVSVSRATINLVRGFQWRVTFLDQTINRGNVPMIQFQLGTVVGGVNVMGRVVEAQSGIAVPSLVTFPGTREVQVLLTSHATTSVTGYFRLSYKGSTWTNYLRASVSANDLRNALQLLPTVGRVTVNSYGSTGNGWHWGVTFDSAVGNLPALAVDASKIQPVDVFVGVKDGDNAVDLTGARCLPGEPPCPGTWSSFTTGVAALATIGEAAVDYQFRETKDANTLTYQLTGLHPGTAYYVSVTAKNERGRGLRVSATPAAILPPRQVPLPPTSVAVAVNPGVATQLRVSWQAPSSDGGDAIRMYRIEYAASPQFTNRGQQDVWCPKAPTLAVWKVDTYRDAATPGGDAIADGFFRLVLTRQGVVTTSEPIPWNAVATSGEELGHATPSQSKVFCMPCSDCTRQCDSLVTHPFGQHESSGSLQSVLQYMATLTKGVQVTRTTSVAGDGGYTWTITFQDVGNDFVLTTEPLNALTCATPLDGTSCHGASYRVRTTQLVTGLAPAACTGSHVIPATGALNKGQLYYVRVFAFNELGFGAPGLAPSPQKPMVVPGPPTGVTLQVLTFSELQVLFSPPDDNGGDTIVEYLVEWATSSSFANAKSGSVVSFAGGAPFYRVISGLTKGVFYFVRVKARNSQGYGRAQDSSPASLNPYTRPSAPTQVSLGVTASSMLTVQWDVPLDDGGDNIKGYRVEWDISVGFDSLVADSTVATINDVAQRSYTITLLTPGTMYYVRVLAINAGGAGTPQTSTPASLQPVATRPGKPHTLTAGVTTTAGQLTVTWQTPRVPAHGIPCSGTLLVPLACPLLNGLDVVYGGSSLESYLVHWSDRSDFAGASWLSVSSSPALLTGLDSGKLYYIRVLTVNAQGLKSDFCARSNSNGYLCPDNLVLLNGEVVTGTLVTATPL